MTTERKVIVAGLGEVGRPVLDLIGRHCDVVGVDVAPVPVSGPVDVLHICYPFQINDFVGETAKYIRLYEPSLTIINSTVGVGTTRAIAQRTSRAVVNSPVRGKHAHMIEDLYRYTKFIGAMDVRSGEHAARHFEEMGLKTKTLSSPEATELAKLSETTYFGLLIAWAQEIERYCDEWGPDFDEVAAFYDEIKFFPTVKYFPGIIGGHCVMPNIRILKNAKRSLMLEAIEASNQMKIDREACAQESLLTTTAAAVR